MIAVNAYGKPVSELSETEKQKVSALATLAAGLAGGLAGDSTADVVAGAQAGQNEISNNMTSMGMLQMMPAKSLLDAASVAEAGQGGANEQAALALTKAVKQGLDAACLANTSCVLMAVVAAQQHTNGAGSKTETVLVNDDLTGGKLVSPAQDESKGTSLTTPDQSGDQGGSNTGNTDGAPDTGGNTTVTPIPEQNKDDLAYLALKGKEAQEAAGKLGFDRRIPAQKAPFNSHGQPVYYDGENYITPTLTVIMLLMAGRCLTARVSALELMIVNQIGIRTNKMFRILSNGTPINIDGELAQPASIVIDEFEESLSIPLSYWSLIDYKKYWLKSLEEGLSSNTHSALAVSMYDPIQTNFIFTWVLYFEGNNVYVHNNVVFLDEHKDFTPESINKFVEPRTTHDEDGMKISEWNTNLKSILDFYHSLKN